MSEHKVHVAAEDPAVRRSLRSTIESYGVGEVVEMSPEGAAGAMVVAESRPGIVVLAVSAKPTPSRHVGWYREAAPTAYIVGFAFNEAERASLAGGGTDEVVMSNVGRAGFLEVMRRAERQARSG